MRWKMAQAGACLILVLGWSLTSAADDGVWIEDAGSGCALWNDHPHETVATDWSGPCEDGKASGLGAMIWWNGERFEGEFINDLGHGIGVCRTEEGAMAACEFTTGAFTRWVE